MNLDEYKVGDKVLIFTWDVTCDFNEQSYKEGIVVDIGTYNENTINGIAPHSKVKVKYLRTYWNPSSPYEKEVEQWVYYKTQIKLK